MEKTACKKCKNFYSQEGFIDWCAKGTIVVESKRFDYYTGKMQSTFSESRIYCRDKNFGNCPDFEER